MGGRFGKYYFKFQFYLSLFQEYPNLVDGFPNLMFCFILLKGGQSNNIEESTVMSLFASGYETKVSSIPTQMRSIQKLVKGLHTSQAAHQTGAYPGFCSMK